MSSNFSLPPPLSFSVPSQIPSSNSLTKGLQHRGLPEEYCQLRDPSSSQQLQPTPATIINTVSRGNPTTQKVKMFMMEPTSCLPLADTWIYYATIAFAFHHRSSNCVMPAIFWQSRLCFIDSVAVCACSYIL